MIKNEYSESQNQLIIISFKEKKFLFNFFTEYLLVQAFY